MQVRSKASDHYVGQPLQGCKIRQLLIQPVCNRVLVIFVYHLVKKEKSSELQFLWNRSWQNTILLYLLKS